MSRLRKTPPENTSLRVPSPIPTQIGLLVDSGFFRAVLGSHNRDAISPPDTCAFTHQGNNIPTTTILDPIPHPCLLTAKQACYWSQSLHFPAAGCSRMDIILIPILTLTFSLSSPFPLLSSPFPPTPLPLSLSLSLFLAHAHAHIPPTCTQVHTLRVVLSTPRHFHLDSGLISKITSSHVYEPYDLL